MPRHSPLPRPLMVTSLLVASVLVIIVLQIATPHPHAVIETSHSLVDVRFQPGTRTFVAIGIQSVQFWTTPDALPETPWPQGGDALAWSPDGQTYALFAAAPEAYTLTIARSDTHAVVTVVSVGRVVIDDLRWSPDGGLLAASRQDGTIILWDTQTWQTIEQVVLDQRSHPIAWSPDGHQLAIADGQTLMLWDRTTHGRQAIDRDTASIGSIDWSSDGQLLAYAGARHVVVLRATATGWVRTTLPELAEGAILVVRFQPGQHLVVTGSGSGASSSPPTDTAIRVWHAETGALLRTLHGQNASVSILTFSSDGEWLAAGSSDGRLLLWEATWQDNRP